MSKKVLDIEVRFRPHCPEWSSESGNLASVPMARRKHLFSSRTQKLSSPAAIILRKWETSTVPNYIEAIRIGWLLSFAIIYNMRNTTALEKLTVSVINFSPCLLLATLLSQTVDWRITLVASFLLYQLIIVATPSKHSLGMRLLRIKWAKEYSTRNHVIFAFLYSLSFATIVVWVVFPFDILLVNLLLVQLPMVLRTGCTVHGYFSGRIYGVRSIS